jgi:hypothetical protein
MSSWKDLVPLHRHFPKLSFRKFIQSSQMNYPESRSFILSLHYQPTSLNYHFAPSDY